MYSNILVLDDGTEIQAGAEGSAITSLVYTSTVSSTTDLCPGAACAGKIEFTVWVDPGSALVFTSGTRVQYYQEDGTGARSLVGTFWAVKPTKQSRNTYKVYAYDAVSKLDGIQSTWLRSIQDSFPMSLWDFSQSVAQQCGVSLESTELPRSGDYQVQAFYADNLTGRQLLQWVAEASCTFLRATPDGGVAFDWYTQNPVTGIFPDAIEHWVALDLSGYILAGVDGTIWTYSQDVSAYRSGGLRYEEYTTALIDKVQIKQSDDDVGVIYPPDETGKNALVIQGNLLLTTKTAAALQPVAQGIFETMQEISYTPLTASLFSEGRTFSAGQIITATDPWGNSLQTYIMTVQQQGGRISVESTGNASRDGTAAVNEQKYTNLRGKMLEIQTSVDGLNIKASELGGQYTQLNLTVDGLTTKTDNLQGDYTQLEQTVDGLDLTVVKKGQVRTQFAADADSVTINSGLVQFTSNTLAIDSTNFKLTEQGDVTGTGTFSTVSGNLRSTVYNGGFYSYINNNLAFATYGYEQDGQYMGAVRCYGESNNGGRDDFAVMRAGLSGGEFALTDAYGNQNVQIINGVITAAGLGISGTKNRIVDTSFGRVKMHALESPKPCFMDFGTGTCDENGICLLTIDPRVLETLMQHHQPMWTITPNASGQMWVEPGWVATVHGEPGQPFTWQVIAPQICYGDQYADLWDSVEPPTQNPIGGTLHALEDGAHDASEDAEKTLWGMIGQIRRADIAQQINLLGRENT